MLDFWDSLLERPKWQRVSMWVGSLLFMTFIFWQYSYSSSVEEHTKLNDRYSTLQSQLATETAIVNNLPKFKKEVEKLNELYDVAVRKLPQKREIASLLESVSGLAKDSGLDVKRFAPRQDVTKDFYAEVLVDVEMKGTFHKVVTFFDELSRMSRIVNVQEIALKHPRGYSDSEGVDVDVTGLLKTFRYLEPEERIQQGPDGEDAKGKRGKRK